MMKQFAERLYPEDSSSYVHTPEGRIRTSARGSHVDINVRLYLWGRNLFHILVAAAAVGLAFMTWQIVSAFASGRVHQILQMIQKAGQ